MSNEQQTTQTPPPKKIKKQGPVRWGAVIFFAVFVGLIALYSRFFMDTHLRMATAWGLTQALGVEVNVAKVETSFWNAHLKIQGIEVTNAEVPKLNSLSVGEIRFGMLWDALLRAKFVVNEAVIEQLEYGKPRSRPGWVRPPEPPSADDGKPSLVETEAKKISDKALGKVEKQHNENLFGDLAAILGGSSAQVQLDKLEGSLASKPMARDLEQKVKSKDAEWQARFKTLPKESEFKALADRMQKVKTKDFKTPQELETSLRELDTIFKEADAKIKTVQQAGQDLDKDLKDLAEQARALEAQIKADLKKLETHFRIPSLDAAGLTRSVFMEYLDPYLRRFKTYRDLATKYIPPNLQKKGEPDPSMQPRPRAEGVSYEFGRPNAYPLFWVKRTAISSQAGASAYAGEIKGELLDLASNQLITNKPTILNVAGGFPAQQIEGFKTMLKVDNRGEKSRVDLDLAIASYSLAGRELMATPDVTLAFDKAKASLEVKSWLVGLKEFELKIDNRFTDIGYAITAKNSDIDQLLKSIFNGIPMISVEGRLWGEFPRLSTALTSNLGEQLAKGLEREIKAKIAEARAKIEKYVQDEVGKAKAQVDGEIAKLKNQVEGEIKKLQAQAEAQKAKAQAQAEQAKKDAEQQAQAQINNEKKKAEDEAKKAAEKAAQDLKKRLGL